jgi:hypothetical protein
MLQVPTTTCFNRERDWRQSEYFRFRSRHHILHGPSWRISMEISCTPIAMVCKEGRVSTIRWSYILKEFRRSLWKAPINLEKNLTRVTNRVSFSVYDNLLILIVKDIHKSDVSILAMSIILQFPQNAECVYVIYTILHFSTRKTETCFKTTLSDQIHWNVFHSYEFSVAETLRMERPLWGHFQYMTRMLI